MVGRWKLPDIGPVRLAREKATAKTISSLTIGIVLKFFPERGSGILGLKDYPPAGFRVNLEHDWDIPGIPEDSRRTSCYSYGLKGLSLPTGLFPQSGKACGETHKNNDPKAGRLEKAEAQTPAWRDHN